jgi:hypothetical protein
MKWAYLKYHDLCLPEAAARGYRVESFPFFTKVNFFPRLGQNAVGVSLLSDRYVPYLTNHMPNLQRGKENDMNMSQNITRLVIGVFVFCIVLQFTFPVPVFAQYNRTGAEFQVNTYMENAQEAPSVAKLSGGGFAVTWQSDAQDGDWYGIYGQVFDSSGNKVGSEFQVNTYISELQVFPSVAGLSGGGFVVTWDSVGQDSSGDGIYGQIFDSSGSKVGGEFQVNTYTKDDQSFSSVAGLSGGGFVVTWESYDQDGSDWGVYGQVFNSSGNKVGSEFQVNTYTTDYQGFSSVAGLSGGGFVVTWESYDQDGSDWGVYGQKFSCGGEVCKDELLLNFGPVYGLYQYDQAGGYKRWNTVNPSQVVTVDLNRDGQDELVAVFQGYGLYTYDSTNGWKQINTVIPEFMGAGRNNRIACDYGATYGLWLWDLTEGWRQINTVDPDKMVASDIDGDGQDEMIVSFMGYGLYYYDVPGVWTQIDIVIPENMIRFNNGIACDFGSADGLRIWTLAGGWQQWNTADPGQMVAVDIDNDGVQELVVSFPGYGLYYDDGTGAWPQINTVIPENMIRLNDGIACDFGAPYGLWVWSQGGGWVHRNTVDPGQMTAVDIDKDGVEELVASFSGYGLYYLDETNGWQLLNAVVPDEMKPINFYPQE